MNLLQLSLEITNRFVKEKWKRCNVYDTVYGTEDIYWFPRLQRERY